MSRWRDEWPAFEAALHRKLDAGFASYGDASFERDPASLLGELEAEALDLCGWGLMVFTRIQAMKRHATALQQEVERLEHLVEVGQQYAELAKGDP